MIDNLISYWKLDEASGNAIDAHGSNNGTVSGATQNQTGKIGTAYTFDGTNDYVETGYTPTDTTLTLTYWAKFTYSGSYDVTGVNDGSNHRFYAGRFNSNGNCFIGAGDSYKQADTSGIVEGEWCFITFTVDGSTAKMYVNATEKSSLSYTQTGDSSLPLRIGNLNNYAHYHEGTIDEVGIWGRVLTTDEITALYNSGDGWAYPFSTGGTDMQINIGDAWKAVPAMQINIGDAWKPVAGAQINIGDAWKTIF